MAKTREPYPLPLAEIARNPVLMALPAAAYVMTLRLIIHYSLTECRPLPNSKAELAHIARAHRVQWAQHGEDIKRVLDAVLPAVESYKKKRDGNRAGLLEASARSNSTQRLKALREKRPAHAAVSGAVIVPKRDAIQTVRPAPPGERNRPRLTDRI